MDAKKSCLDLIIISRDLLKFVREVVIDKHLKFTPSRPLKGGRVCFPDHYAMLLVLEGMPLVTDQIKRGPRSRVWNLNAENGWKKYWEITNNNAELNKISKEKGISTTEQMNKIEKEIKKVKFQSFGKVTVRNEQRASKELRALVSEKIKVVSDLAESKVGELEILEKQIQEETISCQRQNFEQQLKKLKSISVCKGKSAAIFNLRDSVIGEKKIALEAIVMKDPNSNLELTNPKSIRSAALFYCYNLLQNREPKADFAADIASKNNVRSCIQNERNDRE